MGNTRTGAAQRQRQNRVVEAAERQAAYDALSLSRKIARALERGHDQTSEYTRLLAQQEAS